MQRCWQFKAENRCSFEDVVAILQEAMTRKSPSGIEFADNPAYGLCDPGYENPISTKHHESYIEVLDSSINDST